MTTLFHSFTPRQLKRHGFLRGAASVLDLRGNTKRQYRQFPDSVAIDRAAIAQDWQQVGHDLRGAMNTYDAADR